ncbi:MAG: hypothetical protein LM514_02210, partial [Streptococcus sp.]|nr:hypothetical protein [Streptococcus sp.]
LVCAIWFEAQPARAVTIKSKLKDFIFIKRSYLEWLGDLRHNVRGKRATTAGRQARAGENVQRTTGPGLVTCRWRSA